MKYSDAEPLILDGLRAEAKLKGIDLEQDRTLDQWSVMILVVLQHIFDNRGISWKT